jgi:chitin-binding protein
MLFFQIKNTIFSFLFISFLIPINFAYSHGLIEDPPSREFFCGKITRPEHTESKELPYEACRPILKKEGKYNNDIYQFMSVLSHSRGYYKSQNLPAYVCGFGTETFQGLASPWDALINWPTTNMSAGPHTFTWDVSYGPHFSDTENFRYWITVPTYQFSENKQLQWSDLEEEPFCEIPWDDNAPNKDPNIQADKPNNKFHMVCKVPHREGRHLIYAEWGRTMATNERFHSCIDVNFQDSAVHGVKAKISPITSKNVYGDNIINLNGSESVGDKLEYQWVVESHNPELYKLIDGNKAIAKLELKNPEAVETITVVLRVSNSEGTSNAEVKLIHYPAQFSQWIDLGKLTNVPQKLEIGDQINIRTVQKNGKDVYYPAQPLTITEDTKAEDIWPLVLGQAVNQLDSSLHIGVMEKGAGAMPQAVQHATENTMYAKQNSEIQSAYLQIRKSPSTISKCMVTLKEDKSPWWAGLEIATDLDKFQLDFSKTGVDLSQVTMDPGPFTAEIVGQTIQVTGKPSWVTINHSGYLGLNGNVGALTQAALPECI